MSDHDCLPPDPEVMARLVSAQREFLSFLERRLPSRAAAEEVLQAAFVRALERGSTLRESDSAVAWFYRLLRNALVDYHRRQTREARALTAHEHDLGTTRDEAVLDSELHRAVCACVGSLLPNLKAEYSEVLRRVDLEETPLHAVADGLGITANNAAVRLHRARSALKRQLEQCCGACAAHGCLDCSCEAN